MLCNVRCYQLCVYLNLRHDNTFCVRESLSESFIVRQSKRGRKNISLALLSCGLSSLSLLIPCLMLTESTFLLVILFPEKRYENHSKR